MVRALAFLALLLAFTAPAAAEPYSVPRSEVRTITARSGAEYRIMIYRPDAPPPAAGYPILYVLDGDDFFAVAAETLKRFNRVANSGVGPGIVVGIGYPGATRRALDYTPRTATPAADPGGQPTGGAAAFRAFLVDELRPAIERDFPIDRRRQAIFGHSYGGLFALDTLFLRPDLFQTWIVSSPSIWFGDRAVLANEADFVARLRGGGIHPTLVLTVGELEAGPPAGTALDPAREAVRARLGSRRMVEDNRELAARLAALPGLTLRHRVLIGESHGTAPLPAIGNALPFIFGGPR